MESNSTNINIPGTSSVGKLGQGDQSTAMETDEHHANNAETASGSQGMGVQQMAAEKASDDAYNHNASSRNQHQASTSAPDPLEVAHDNLATLAAVSAAGAEAVAQQNLANPQGNQNPRETPSTSTSSQQQKTPAAAPAPPPPIDEEDIKWHTVGIFQGLSTTVTNYIDNTVWTSSGLNLNSDEIPELSEFDRINLDPGTAYRFRIRALNSVGASDWSEISSFKTCLPGFPGAPSAIKISKSSEGAHLTWEPPPSCVSSNEIVEYSVYLAVKPGKDKEAKAGQRAPAQLAFVRVYVGAANQCTVSHQSLSAAHVDCSNKPAIIFRIAARNEKGYGPATQVRWLQDPVQNLGINPGMAANSLLSPTRIKPELGGASPSKRFKAAPGR